MSWQLSTAGTEVLDDSPQRRYCLIIFARLQSAAPSTSPDLEHGRIGGFRPRFVPQFSNHFPGCLFVRRHVRETDGRIGLRFGPRPGADPTVHHTSTSSRCHGGTPVRSRCVGRCAQRAHHREPQLHRRSEWAGVSWPKDDRDEEGVGGATGLARRRETLDVPRTSQALHFAHSSAPWRGRPHARVLSWN